MSVNPKEYNSHAGLEQTSYVQVNLQSQVSTNNDFIARLFFRCSYHVPSAIQEALSSTFRPCRFHLGEFKGSIHDCEITLGLNAYHFGAMVGQVI